MTTRWQRLSARWARFDNWMQESWTGNIIVVLCLILFFLVMWFATP